MPTQNIAIRPMRKNDAMQVCKMVKALAAHFGDKARVTERDLLTYCFGKEKLSTIFLAFDADKPVGLAITREWMNFYLGTKFRHIDFIFVEDKRRRSGTGAALIAFVAQDALKSGCRRLSLDVGIDNQAARALYEKLGFEKRGNISDHYRLSDADLVKLAKRWGRKK
jgi:predicted GNAT family acetyltransferase